METLRFQDKSLSHIYQNFDEHKKIWAIIAENYSINKDFSSQMKEMDLISINLVHRSFRKDLFI